MLFAMKSSEYTFGFSYIKRQDSGSSISRLIVTQMGDFNSNVVPKRDGKTISWKTVQEQRINKPSQQFMKKQEKY